MLFFSFDELIIYFDEREHYNGYNIVIKKTNQSDSSKFSLPDAYQNNTIVDF